MSRIERYKLGQRSRHRQKAGILMVCFYFCAKLWLKIYGVVIQDGLFLL